MGNALRVAAVGGGYATQQYQNECTDIGSRQWILCPFYIYIYFEHVSFHTYARYYKQFGDTEVR